MTQSQYTITPSQIRVYERAESVVFFKTREAFGGLSNMAAGFPLVVNGVPIRTSEALYQACRFPDLPDIQAKIIEQASPMSAKMVGKPFRHQTRPDWEAVRMNIMRWCLRVKLAQNWQTFGDLLLETGSRPIVEQSRKDEYWGAKPTEDGTLVGMNVLGRLLMELREQLKGEDRERLKRVEPLRIPHFWLYGEPIRVVGHSELSRAQAETATQPVQERKPTMEQREVSFTPAPRKSVEPEPGAAITADRPEVPALRPYAEYKDSGSPWLAEVPSHWEVRNLRTLIRRRNERNRVELPLLSVAREKGVFVRSLTDPDENHNVIPEDLSNYKVARAGSLVINKMKAWQGSLGIAPVDGIVSPAYFVFDFAVANPAFGQALLRSKPYVAHFGQASDGVRVGQWDLSIAGMRQIPVLLPPADEQVAIVRFLNWANGRLERAIRAKRKIIALLNEQKQAIIHSAVTRGLDPSVPLKRSGIPWLGDIPQHWEVVRSRRLFTARKQLAMPEDVQLAATQAYGVIPQDEFERRVGRRVVKIFMHLEKRKHVERNDFVMSMRSFQGGLERAWAEGAIRSSYVILKPSNDVDVDFFTYLLKSRGYIGALQATSNFIRDGQDLTETNFRQVDLPLPPKDEQARIADYVSKTTASSMNDATRLEREVDLLREYRARLAADVVTGKLDVREATAHLLDEAPPEATGDETDSSDAPETADEEAVV